MSDANVSRRTVLTKAGGIAVLAVGPSVALAEPARPAEGQTRGPGRKVYRHAADGPTGPTSPATTVVLTALTCRVTEDNAGPDDCELRVWADNTYQSHRRSMDNGDVWTLGLTLTFSYRIKIELWELGNPGFPLYDDHDHLGTVTINPDQPHGTAAFTQDGADYRIEWGPVRMA